MLNNDKHAHFFILFVFISSSLFSAYKIFDSNTVGLVKMSFLLLTLYVSTTIIGYLIFKLANEKIFIFQTIFERSKDAIAIIDDKGYYKWQNSANIEFSGFNNSEIVKQKATLLINNTSIDLKTELDSVDAFSGIFKTKCKKGAIESFVSAYKITDDFGATICYVEMKRSNRQYTQILENTKKEKERIEQIANSDNLTKALNRNGFFEALDEKFFGKKAHGSVIFADIDNFKKLNDTYGHDFGDKVLKHTASLYKANIRQSDLLARFGGEEFVIWLEAPIDTAYEICEKIRITLAQTTIDDISITSSFGIANVNSNIEDAIKNADSAMYIAKTTGKNKTVIYNGQ